jgi:hypothetical protein
MPLRDDVRKRCRWPSAARRCALLALLIGVPAACSGSSNKAPPGESLQAMADSGAPVVLAPVNADAGVEPAGAGPDAAAPGPLPVGIAQLPDVASGASPDSDVVASGIVELLDVYCADCHSNAESGEGFSNGLDLAALIETGLIVPGSSATSPLLQRIADGSMPPDSRAPTAGDITLLGRFIDQLGPASTSCSVLPFLGLDSAYAAMLADLRARPELDRRFLRYVGIMDASNARRCGPALDRERQALFKLINSLSTAEAIRVPTAIDDDRLLYRVDLRDYGWARPIDLEDDGEVDHPDGWEALLSSAGPYAVELGGPEAGALVAEAGSKAPFLPASAFVRAAAVGDVYYSLVDIGSNIYETMSEGGFDVEAALIDGDVRRAAADRGSFLGDIVVSHYLRGGAARQSLWQAEIQDQVRSGTIYDSPEWYINFDWSQTILELPNGLHAYATSDRGGGRLYQAPRACGDNCERAVEQHAIPCMGCHATGLLPVDDIMVDFVERNRTSYDDQTYAAVIAIYPTAAEFAQLVADENAKYLAALEEANVASGSPDPVSALYLDSQRPLDLERAAAALGVPDAVLAANLGMLSPALAPLATAPGTVERAAFDAAYVQALCALQTRNRPLTCP